MPTYTCEKCTRIFKQKSHYTAHLNKKVDCSTVTAITPIIEEMKEIKKEVKSIGRGELVFSDDPNERRKALTGFFEDLHNLLWNQAGLSPERALEHMIFFFAYRLIELQADTLNLPQECRWSYLVSLKNENDLFETIKRGVSSFRIRPRTKPFFKPHEIQKATIVYDIIHLIHRIPLSALQETDTLGDIFEYMLGRGMSTMADEGQYFTMRALCDMAFRLAYKIKNGQLRREDGSLCTFADWFCGTGGFPASYVKGIKQYLPDVNWKQETSSIYCQDMNLSSVTTTLLNLLILTGVPFSGDTIRSANSFTDPITLGAGAPYPGLTIDYCFMNPPYGGDKSKGKEYKFAYSKGKGAEKHYLVNQDIQTIGVEDNDKVSAGVQLAMATLSENGGVCCIVLPQGFFFGASKPCVELRKKIATDYRIHYVVDVASGAFANTGTKTSMLVFQKGVGATERVQFMDMDEKVLVEATLEELRAKNYSLNYKQYLPQSAVEVDGFEIKKLSDIASDITFGFMVSSNDYGLDGVPVIKTKNIKHKSVEYPAKDQKIRTVLDDRYKVNKGDLLIVLGGSPGENGIWNHTEYAWLNQDCANIKIDNEITKKYVFYMLESDLVKTHITSNITKTTIGHISRGVVRDIPIPLPSLERQQEIVDSIDGFTQLAHAEEQSLKMLEKSVMFEVKWMGMGKERVKLGEVCDFWGGKAVKKEDRSETGTVPYYGSNGITGFMDSELFNGRYIITGQDGTLGTFYNVDNKFWASNHTHILRPKDSSKLLHDALYYSLLVYFDVDKIETGSCIPKITLANIKSVEIPFPTLAEQQMLQSDFEEIRHKHAKIAEYRSKAQAAIMRLIPGAKKEEQVTQVPIKPSIEQSHSSTCEIQEDGSGCTCKNAVVSKPIIRRKKSIIIESA